MITEGDPDPTIYLSEKIRTNIPEHQNNMFWFPTHKKSGEAEDHTPIQTRILQELRELQEKETLNPKDDVESRMKFLERFYWTDTLLTETEKHAVENILIQYLDIFAGHRRHIGMNTNFKEKLLPKGDEAVSSQKLPMPTIHLKRDLIMHMLNSPSCTDMGL